MSTRRPKEFYKGKNGFDQGSLAKEGLKDAEAAEAQDFARFIIREMGSHFPSIEEMKAQSDANEIESVATIQARITKLKAEHTDVMTRLSAYFDQTVEDDARDQYLQTDDLRYFDDLPEGNEWAEHYARLESFFDQYSRAHSREFKNIFEQARYDHLQTLLPLYKRRAELQELERQARMRRAMQFPQSINEFRSVEFRDAQLRVARFLMGDEGRREQMRGESQWAWRQTEPLIREFTNNKEFHKEIEDLIRANESRDPRSRR